MFDVWACISTLKKSLLQKQATLKKHNLAWLLCANLSEKRIKVKEKSPHKINDVNKKTFFGEIYFYKQNYPVPYAV